LLSIYSPNWGQYDSYGILAQRLAARAGVCNRLSPTDEDGTVMIPSPGGIFLGYPTLMKAYSVVAHLGRKVAVTMFESTVLPSGWCETLNMFDAVIVPARFLVQVLIDNGVDVPIHVVPLGVDEAYKQVERPPRGDRPYTFLALADRGIRKGWDTAWHAFRSAFGDSEEYKLILKCREGGMAGVNSADANVEILRADMTVAEMAQLYAECDCFVFPTRGEGFGLPPREFAATGGAVLATHWGGTADDIECWGYRIPYRMVDAWPFNDEFRGKCGQWAEPDVEKLTGLMRIVSKYDHLFAKASRDRKDTVAWMYDWKKWADRVLEIYYGA